MTLDLSGLVDVFRVISDSIPYRAALVFYGAYPITMACVWIVLSVGFARRREGKATSGTSADGAPPVPLPFVSVVIPAHAEAATIGRTLDALLAVDYPTYEVIVVNDGSPDDTAEVVRRYLHTDIVRLLDKTVNEGKAMGLNDAIPLCRGEIVVVLDADIVVTPGVLRALVPHFESPRVGAVTGNPRVANRGSLLRNLQTLEFASIVSVQRRAQRVWGRVLTVSGAIAAFRKTALVDAGLFSPDMATEDIDMTWKLQRRFWDVRYEASAVVWMEVPPTLGELWKQRRRWARGLAQVLSKHRGVPFDWRLRRLWPVFWEGVLSITWAYTFLALTTYWVVAHGVGFSPYGSSPIPNLWGMLTATACLAQLGTGVLLDRRYDPRLARYFPFAVLYPLVYWMLMSVISAIYTIDGLLRRRPAMQVWNIQRVGGASLLALAFALPHDARAQDATRARADSLVSVGDLAAGNSKPRAAIDAYERAIALEPGRRVALLPRLGRQYLWSDAPREAARLFTDYLADHAESCETRLDLGLALSWANALGAARATYDDVAARCLYERGDARLGAARVLRWGNHLSEADRRYRAVLADGSDRDREQAAIGLAYVRLARAEPRAALATTDSLLAAGSHDPSLVEARVMALADLGALGSAVDAVRAERTAGRGSASMDRLVRGWEERSRASFTGAARGFRDRDGTSYRAVDVGSATAPIALGAVRLDARAAELRTDSVTFRSREMETAVDLRPARALALSARAGLRSYDDADFSPWDGEVNVAWLIGDRRRVDVSGARLVIGDNPAAIVHRLSGNYGSIGLTERLTSRFSTALSADMTRWSEGNTRFRLRATPRFTFEGVPVVTIEWPTIYQRYDVPFAFLFFSPKQYTETGPAVAVDRRVRQVWYLSAYARAGGLREAGRSWQALGIGRASVEREVRAHWGVRVDAAWSNSNLAGSAGFQRTTLGAGFTIRP